MADTFVHFEIPANDPDNLMRFYGNVFNWQFQRTPMPGGGGEYIIVMTTEQGKPGMNGGMYKRTAPDDKARHYIGVANMDEALRKVRSAGGTVAAAKMPIPAIGWFAFIVDPEGNPQALFQEDKSAK